ncbi:MAG: iron-sulfur cluster assembly accessory protein [Gammaproteobacteria bacterium]|nr:MAG: iron-sulfur cluster assembly accessory protein [Gammaproteobacteria bacterium]
MKREITLSEAAATHVRRILAADPGAIGLRVGVRPAGCSGHTYHVEPAREAGEQDESFESRGIRIVVDRDSLPFLVGTEIDYVREGLNAGLRFNNPNVAATCGCGESFSVS